MKAFEIHTFRGGKWKIDSIFDDRELAMFEAKRIDSSNRFPGVRVVEEIFNEVQSKTTTRTIFRGGVGAEMPQPPPKKATERAKPAARGGARKGATSRGRPPAKKKSGIAGPLMICLVVIVLGAAAMFGLQYIPRFP